MNNKYCILLSKLLLPLLHKPADLIYRAGYSLPWKLNSNHIFYISTWRREKQQTCAADHTPAVKKLCMFFLKIPMFNYLLFIFLTCNINTVASSWHWKEVFTLNTVMFMFLSCVANKQCSSGGITSRCVPYFHPTLPSDVPTLKSNRVVKQSLKQPLCNH